MNDFPESELVFVREAAQFLENPSVLMVIADRVGKPLDIVASAVEKTGLPVNEVADVVLKKMMELAANTVAVQPSADEKPLWDALNKSGWEGLWHLLTAAAAGAAVGPFGLAGAVPEVAFTTGVMFRSIYLTALAMGEQPDDPATRLECLTVFSLGSGAKSDDAMDSTYLSSRLVFAQLVDSAAAFLAKQGGRNLADAVARNTAPVLVKLIAQVASRFNVVLTEKLVAQSLPGIAIVTGAAINAAFTDHFNRVARYHFGLRKLERQYGAEKVLGAYRSYALEARASGRLVARE